MTCHEVRLLLGVHALGKSDPDERALVEAHVASCRDCREELAGLEGLPALLDLTRPRELAPEEGWSVPSVPVQTSPDQLRRLLAAAARTHTRRRWTNMVAAALLLVLAGVGGIVASNRGEAPAPPPAAVATWSATQHSTGVQAKVTLSPRPAGTAIGLTLSGVPAGTRCSLVVTDSDGSATSAASWQADYAGTATVTGFTATPVAGISRLAIVTTDGHTLATLAP
jgi:predicted anti-sigma-YlaC factor YlaD